VCSRAYNQLDRNNNTPTKKDLHEVFVFLNAARQPEIGGKKKREMRRRLGCTRRQWRRSILSFRPERKAFVVVAFEPI
jgi:hypothetical protein